MRKNKSVRDKVAVTPLAISHIPKSVLLSGLFEISSRHLNSQQEGPISKDLQSWGGLHSIVLHDFGPIELENMYV